ncbi:hypothetical protein LUZ60_014892 [Juncus effusus]|nr:hypothetical protein LUZ60_014892 [Juncus effusus]
MSFFRVAGPSEYLAITGFGIKEIKIAKKSFVIPGQICFCFDISPINYTYKVQSISSDKVSFVLPAVLTIGPRTDDKASLQKYARLISSNDKHSDHVKEIVRGIIEGETRVVAASMPLGTIFHKPKAFSDAVLEHVQKELNQFGLLIYNANMRQLTDDRGVNFVSNAGIKMKQDTENKAKVDVAEEKMKGDMGVQEKEGRTAQNVSKVDTETKIYEKKRQGEVSKQHSKVSTEVKIYQNEREAEVAKNNSELATKKAEWERQAKMKQVETAKAVAMRDAELQIEVEQRNAAKQKELLKADFLSKAKVDFETKMREADLELYKRKNAADAALYGQVKMAEGLKVTAEAELFAGQKEADGELYNKQNEANGLVDLAKGQSEYLTSLLKELGGDYNELRNYMMINEGVYEEIAEINSDLLKHLQAEITVMK